MADDEYRNPDEVVRDLRAGLTRPAPQRRSGRPGGPRGSRRPLDRPRVGGRRRRSGPRPALVRGLGLASLLVVIVLVGTGLVRGAADSPAADAGEPAAGVLVGSDGEGAGEADWATVVRDLDTARHAALTGLDDEALHDVYTDTASALDDDLAAVARLRSSGLVPEGLAVEVGSVEEVERSSMDRVEVEVSDRRGPYRMVARDSGEPVQSVPGGARRSWRLVLERTGADWRIARVTPAV